MKFQFDPEKAKSNLKKHMVSFADAEAVFYDSLAIHQEDHYSEGQERFIAIDMKAEYDFSQGKRGALIPSKGKTRITIYVENEILEEFRSRAEEVGAGYQTIMNNALKEYLNKKLEKPLT